jgi:hypothetical protein
MEDVLSVYERAYNPRRPVVCLDEKAKELQAHTAGREPLPPRPSPKKEEARDGRQDYEYKRGGMANLFMVCEPLRGWRRVAVTSDRTAATFAHQLKELVDQDYPDAERIVLVTDNVNTHGIWCLYEVFRAEEAKRIADKLEWHYTPEHGSWLNMAEIELSVLQNQCLKRRIPDVLTLSQETSAWARERNSKEAVIDWQFTTRNARIKLRRLYPVQT